MKNNSMMSVKAMIDLYLEYNLCEETWTMMYNMTMHRLISQENWKKFFDTCKGWHFVGEFETEVADENEKIVYRYDENGYLAKV